MAPARTRAELVELLADKEHEGWSRWMEYLFGKCGPDPTHSGRGSLLILPEDVEHWKKLIDLPYAALAEHSKQADRDEVEKIMPILVEFVAEWIQRSVGRVFADQWREQMKGE